MNMVACSTSKVSFKLQTRAERLTVIKHKVMSAELDSRRG